MTAPAASFDMLNGTAAIAMRSPMNALDLLLPTLILDGTLLLRCP